MRMQVERMQGAKNTDLHALSAGPSGGCTEQGIEQGPVIVGKGPQDMGHGEGNVLPVAVRQNMNLLRSPLLCGFETAGAAGF